MIINKVAKEFRGQIEYRYDFSRTKRMMMEDSEICEDDMYRTALFTSLTELLEKVSAPALDAICKEFDADKAWVSRIIFHSKSEDGETEARIALEEHGKHFGNITTKINNEDVENRLLLNLGRVKQIVDNTLEQYPIKY